MVKRSCGSGYCGTFVLGFGFDEVNQSRSSGPDPLISDPLHFRVESKRHLTTETATAKLRFFNTILI
jgi:hypothetical protein